MTVNKIVILTNRFPLTVTAESFLGTELTYHLNDVLIFPADMSKYSVKREIPDNCKMYRAKSRSKIIKHFTNGFNALGFLLFKELLVLIKSNNLNVHNILLALLYIGSGKEICRYIKRILLKSGVYKSDFIVFYSYWMNQNAYAAILLKKEFPNSIAITRCHGYDLYEHRSKHNYIPLRQFIFKNIDAVYPCSQDGREYIEKKYQIQPSRLCVMRLGTVDYGIQAYYESENTFRIISCSSIIEVKRVHLLINALGLLNDSPDLDIEWVHFGDGCLMEEIKKLAKEKLGKSVKYCFKGEVENFEVLKYYKDNYCDLFINTSESEGIPVSIMEASSFGIPVIATDVGGSGEIVKNNYNGFLIDKDFEVDMLKDFILKFYHMSDEEYKVFRFNSRKVWEENYNADGVYPGFIKEISNMANGNKY